VQNQEAPLSRLRANVLQHLFAERIGTLGKGNDLVGDNLLDVRRRSRRSRRAKQAISKATPMTARRRYNSVPSKVSC
jgi:hypothetical protein